MLDLTIKDHFKILGWKLVVAFRPSRWYREEKYKPSKDYRLLQRLIWKHVYCNPKNTSQPYNEYRNIPVGVCEIVIGPITIAERLLPAEGSGQYRVMKAPGFECSDLKFAPERWFDEATNHVIRKMKKVKAAALDDKVMDAFAQIVTEDL